MLYNVLAHLWTKAFKTRFIFQTIRQYSTKIFPSYSYDIRLVPMMKESFKSFYKYSTPPGSRWFLYNVIVTKLCAGCLTSKVFKRMLCYLEVGPNWFIIIHVACYQCWKANYLHLNINYDHKLLILAQHYTPCQRHYDVSQHNTPWHWHSHKSAKIHKVTLAPCYERNITYLDTDTVIRAQKYIRWHWHRAMRAT